MCLEPREQCTQDPGFGAGARFVVVGEDGMFSAEGQDPDGEALIRGCLRNINLSTGVAGEKRSQLEQGYFCKEVHPCENKESS